MPDMRSSARLLGRSKGFLACVGLAAGLFASVATASAQPVDGRWFGRGERDICGLAWAAEFTIDGGKLKGRFWRGRVLYNVYGRVDQAGRLVSIRTGRDRREQGVVGARFLSFELTFDDEADKAEGVYGTQATNGTLACETPIQLSKSLE
jgi:hypothetical protein